jgi:hypothetical protein
MTDHTLADQLAIRELNAAYADAVNRRDAVAWSSVWARDGRWFFLGEWIEDRDAIVARWQDAMSGFPVVYHQITSEQIAVSGDTAKSRVYLAEEVVTAEQLCLRFIGVYNDVCTRLDEGWRYKSRRFDLIYQGPGSLNPEGWLGYSQLETDS